jgi:hypothetical protein
LLERTTPRIDEQAACAGCGATICWDEVFGWTHVSAALQVDQREPLRSPRCVARPVQDDGNG